MTTRILLTLLLGSSACLLSAQSTTGTEFWLAYMENLDLAFNDAPAFSIIINADTPTDGFVEIPTTGLTIPFSAPAGTIEVDLPDAIFYSEGSEMIDNKGLRIVADGPIQVQAFHYRLFFAESSGILPATELGTDYLVTTMFEEGAFGNQPASLVIVATEDNTEVEITPTTVTFGLRPADVPFTVTLNRGQNYQVKAQGELTGTRVRSLSGQPIAVFSGAQQSNVGTDASPCTADSHVWDQTLPVDDWRSLYYFVPFRAQGGDALRILALEDNTTVYFDCGEEATLNAGEFFQPFLTDPTIISSTAPISVTQYTNGFSCEPSGLGDPNALSYLPADFLTTNARWLASGRPNPGADFGVHFTLHELTIVGPTEAVGSVELDGVPVTNFQPFAADPTWSYQTLVTEAGPHQVTADEGVQVYAYGFGFADAYTFNLGYDQVADQPLACLSIEQQGVLCVDSLQTFTANSALNLVSYDWDFGDDNGSADASPTHVYTSTGTYTITLIAIDADGAEVSSSITITVAECPEDCSDPVLEGVALDGELCQDAAWSLTPTFATTVTAIDYSWVIAPNDPIVNMPLTNNELPNTPGTYAVQLGAIDVATGCSLDTILQVTIADCPEDCSAFFIDDIDITGSLCVDSLFTISANVSSTSLVLTTWSFEDGTTSTQEVLTNADFPEAGSYPLQLQITETLTGCTADTTLLITIASCISFTDCAIAIPNIFSPNNDGVNDGFRLFFAPECRPAEVEFFVYNRWGSEVFRTNNPDGVWDGNFNGSPHPQEALIYYCRYTFPDGVTGELKGSVTLVR